MDLPGFITVRTSSSRLPNKCLLPFGNGNVLEHIIRRAKFYEITPIVCTSVSQRDDIIEEICEKKGVICFRGSEHNKLKRWADCATRYNLKYFHTIDADDPFFDGNEIRESMQMLKVGNYDVVYPTEKSKMGESSVGYSLTSEIVKRISKKLPEEKDTEMMWYFLEAESDIKILKPNAKNNDNKTRMRLTLDYQEDYWLLESIRKILGNNASRQEIDDLFKRNPDLYKINWFRNDDWEKNQTAKKIS